MRAGCSENTDFCKAKCDFHGTAQKGFTLTTLSSLRSTRAQSTSLFPEEQVNSTPWGVFITAPVGPINSVFCISSGVIFQSPMQTNGSSHSLMRFTSSRIFVKFSPDSASPFVMYAMTTNAVEPLSLNSCALQSKPERPRTSDFSVLQAASATWFRVAMLVPPDVPLVEFSDCLAVAAVPRKPVCFYSLPNVLMLLTPRRCSASATV